MAGTAHDQCPECGIAIPISIKSRVITHTSDSLVIEVEPDLTDAMAHAWTHQQGQAEG